MRTYKIKISEELIREVEVIAKTDDEALDIVEEMHRKGKIVLGGDDYSATEFTVMK